MFTVCNAYLSEVSSCIPLNLYEDFIGKLQTLILAEKSLLDEAYYESAGSLLNRHTK
jgi:hypothetical protein